MSSDVPVYVIHSGEMTFGLVGSGNCIIVLLRNGDYGWNKYGQLCPTGFVQGDPLEPIPHGVREALDDAYESMLKQPRRRTQPITAADVRDATRPTDRVARAIARESGFDFDALPDETPPDGDHDKEMFRRQAWAAVGAMR